MPFRNWLSHPPIGVGLGIVALLSVAFLAQKHDQAECRDGGPNQYQTCTFDHVSETGISPIHRIQAPQRNPKPQRDEWREESDLYAQWNMAWWARVSAIIAGIGLAITGVGIVLVKQTLDANRAAVEAANRAIESEREIGEAQVRAYLVFDTARLELVAMNGRDGIPQLHFTLTNNGNSPARKITVSARCILPSEPTNIDEAAGCMFESLRSGSSIKDKIHIGMVLPSPEGGGWVGVRFIVKVQFVDVFRKTIEFEQTYLGLVGRERTGNCRIFEWDEEMQRHDPWGKKHPYES